MIDPILLLTLEQSTVQLLRDIAAIKSGDPATYGAISDEMSQAIHDYDSAIAPLSPFLAVGGSVQPAAYVALSPSPVPSLPDPLATATPAPTVDPGHYHDARQRATDAPADLGAPPPEA